MGAQAVPSAVRRLRYIFGAVTQIELKNFLEINSVDSAARKQEIKVAWSSAVERFEELRHVEAGAPNAVGSRALSPQYLDRTEALRSDASFANSFSSYPFSFEEVEIDKLVASQR